MQNDNFQGWTTKGLQIEIPLNLIDSVKSGLDDLWFYNFRPGTDWDYLNKIIKDDDKITLRARLEIMARLSHVLTALQKANSEMSYLNYLIETLKRLHSSPTGK